MSAAPPVSMSAPPLNPAVRVQLSVMMFLQFAVWGAWFVTFGNRLTAVGLGDYVGSMYGTMALGTIFAPLVVGQIADRYFSSERLMGVLHLLGAGLLYLMADFASVAGQSPEAVRAASWQFWLVALAYALVYSPTLSLSNTVAFANVPEGGRDFPGLRVFGTIGWIAVGLFVGTGLSAMGIDGQSSNVPLLLGAGLSAALGVYSFFLPHTPPKGKAGDALPFLKAVGLLQNASFAVFFGASFLITIVLAFYYGYTGVYIEDKHAVKEVSTTMAIGQVAEMLILPLLPFFLFRFGMKWVLALGMLCWGVRYLCFAFAPADSTGFALMLLGIALHGVCFDFFFAAGFIHVDNEAPADIRGSAQALFVFLTYGVGMWLGNTLSEWVKNATTTVTEAGKVTDWQTFWLIPAAGVLAALAIFVLFFRGKR
jgi:nucleoside transporter